MKKLIAAAALLFVFCQKSPNGPANNNPIYGLWKNVTTSGTDRMELYFDLKTDGTLSYKNKTYASNSLVDFGEITGKFIIGAGKITITQASDAAINGDLQCSVDETGSVKKLLAYLDNEWTVFDLQTDY